jgi:glycoside/pentoside/hexuronide:cation symporter, GPH family
MPCVDDKRISTRTKLLFSTGDLTSSLPLAVQMFFQLYFLTDVAGLGPASASWVLGITRAWDSINDPIVGLLSDRIRSRYGRRRVLLMYGATPLGLFFALSWFVPPLGSFGLAAYYTLVLIAFDTAFTVVHVGYNSLTPEMTKDYDERTSLNGYRMMFSLSGTLGAIVYATILSEIVETEWIRFLCIGLSLGAIAVIPPFLVCAVAKESQEALDQPAMPLRAALLATLANRPFVLLMIIYLTSWTSASILAAMLVFYASYYLLVPDQANYFVMAAEGSAVLCIPICVWLANTLDKPRAYVIGTAFWCLVLVTLAGIESPSLPMAYLLAVLCGPGIATAMVIPWSMVPDIIEDDEKTTGRRREGAFYSLVAFFQKLGTGVALWGIGQSLAICGYITPNELELHPQQPESVLIAMRWILGPATIALLAFSLPFAWFYPITRESHGKLTKQLKAGGSVSIGQEERHIHD